MTFNDKAFERAHERYFTDAKSLTDEDLAQLAVIDAGLAERARAKRAGYVPSVPSDPAEALALKQPLTQGDLMKWVQDVIIPELRACRHRIAVLEGIRSSDTQGADFKGEWHQAELYGQGAIVTKAGSLWRAERASIAQAPGESDRWWTFAGLAEHDGAGTS